MECDLCLKNKEGSFCANTTCATFACQDCVGDQSIYYCKECPRKLLIFDIDGTMICTSSTEEKIIPRPDLGQALQLATEKGYDLAVWTAASEFWMNHVLQTLKMTSFVFSWSSLKCTDHYDFKRLGWCETSRSAPCITLKKLVKVWKAFPQYSRETTFIIDDTPTTYLKNKSCALPIQTYHPGTHAYHNTHLIDIIKSLT